MWKLKTTLVVLFLVLFSLNFSHAQEQDGNNLVFEALTPHAPITIDADLDFVGYAFPGSGTSGDPYIIENFEITSSSSYGIRIYDVTKYFIIRNCKIENQDTGIYIRDVPSGTITIDNSICQNNQDYGIWIEESSNVNIANNVCQNNNKDGLRIGNCDISIIVNNTLSFNGEDGIQIRYSDSSIIKENKCYNNDYGGIQVSECLITTVLEDNICHNNYRGISIGNSDNINILDNTIYENMYGGLYVDGSEFINVIGNECFKNEEGVTVYGAGTSEINNNTCYDNKIHGLKIKSSYYSTISYNNLTRNSLEIDESMIGFYLVYTLHNNTVNNLPFGFLTHLTNEIIISDYGQLLLVNCTNTRIENQELVSIKLFDSPYTEIINNTVENGTGIVIIESEYTEIYNNSLTNRGYNGINIRYSQNTLIINNTLKDVDWGGINILYSSFSEVQNNTMLNCWICEISSSDDIKFLNNTLILDYGVRFWNSENLEVKNNIFYKGGFDFGWDISILTTGDFENNLINGLPLGFFENTHDVIISEQYGQLYLVNCDRITVENQIMRDVPQGIYMDFCDNNILLDNHLQSEQGYGTGLIITNSTSLDIINTTFDGFFYGLVFLNSPETLITQSKILNNYIGLDISWGSNNYLITHNLIKNNTRHGIEIGSDNNVIHHNNFIDNRKMDHYGFAQAQDHGTNNRWYDTTLNEGNYWSDWSGVGSYTLDGGSIDPYPLGGQAPINIPEFSANSWFILICGFFLVVLMPLISKKYRN